MTISSIISKTTFSLALIASTAMASSSTLACSDLGKNSSAERQQKRLQHLSERLQLDDTQTSQVQSILERHHAEIKAVRASLKDELTVVLSAEQIEQFESMPRSRRHMVK